MPPQDASAAVGLVESVVKSVQALQGVSFLAGFASMLFLIGLGNYYGYWMWRRDLDVERAARVADGEVFRARLAECSERIEELVAEKEQWKALTIARLQILETQVRDAQRGRE